MNRLWLLLYVVPVILLAYWLLRRSQRAPQPPEATLQALAALRKRGVDLTKPTTITYLLSFDTRLAAENAAHALPPPWATEINELPGQHRWACKAVTRMLPAPNELSAQAQELEAVAMRHGGEYEGWEAAT
jgi:hypothetical protein